MISAGQERFRSITRSYYRNSVGALLLYDTTNYDSFEHVADWLAEAKRQIEPNNVIFMLVGTKTDKEHLREVCWIETNKIVSNKIYNTT